MKGEIYRENILGTMKILLLCLMIPPFLCGPAEASNSTYIITTPSIIRAGRQDFRMFVSILRLDSGPIDVLVSVLKDGLVFANSTTQFNETGSQLVEMMIESFYGGQFELEVEGTVTRSGARVFYNKTDLRFENKAMSVFVQLSRPVYSQGQNVHWRLICVNSDAKPQDIGFAVYVKDPTGFAVRRWLNVRTNNTGVASRSFKLSDQLNFGTWTIEVESFPIDTYKKYFKVEKYRHQRFDVYVSAAPYVPDSVQTIGGTLKANFLNGRAVIGTAEIILTLIPSIWHPYAVRPENKDSVYPQLSKSYDQIIRELNFEFDRSAILSKVQDYWPSTTDLIDFTCMINASVTDTSSNITYTGFSTTKVLNPRLRLAWIGDKVRTFKPGSVLTVYVSAMHFDGSLVRQSENHTIHILKTLRFTGLQIGNSTAVLPEQGPEQGPELGPEQGAADGVVRFDIAVGSNVRDVELQAMLDQDTSSVIRLKATRCFSQRDSYISITSSTENPTVNEAMEFHVKTTKDVLEVFYQVVAKSKVLEGRVIPLALQEKTFSVNLTQEMTPTAHIVVYYNEPTSGELVADTLYFFVNSTSTDRVDVSIEQRSDSRILDVTVKASPGSYVTLSAMAEEVFNKGFKQGITEFQLLDEMTSYDGSDTRKARQVWKQGESEDEYKYFLSPGDSIDSSSAFVQTGLKVFTDTSLPSVTSVCTRYQEQACFDGSCYSNDVKCDGLFDCASDWADEYGCDASTTGVPNITQTFDKDFRFFEDTSWAWREGIVNSDGQVTFQIEPPKTQSTWRFNAMSLDTSKGLTIMHKPVKYETVCPMYITVECPDLITRGEQIGVRITVFNNWYADKYLEITVTMKGGGDKYAFILASETGKTSAYSPNMTDEDHDVSVHLKAGESAVIVMPVVPKIMKGEFLFTAEARSDVANDSVSKRILVEADGIENYYFTPYLIDTARKESLPNIQIPVSELYKVPEVREHLYVPGSAKADMSLYGDVVAPGFTEYKKCKEVLWEQCAGAEESLFNMAYNLFILKYLTILAQVPGGTQENMLQNANLELQKILSYMNVDGSFKMYHGDSENSSSIWLTAFALQTLHDARNGAWEKDFVIPFDLTNKMIIYLCSQQNESGAWNPSGPALDRKFISKSNTSQHDYGHPVPLTAYVLITMVKVQGSAHSDAWTCLERSRKLAEDYLTRELPNMSDKDIFHLAITTYALALKYPANRAAFDRLWRLKKEVDNGTYFSYSDIPENPADYINGIRWLLPRIQNKHDSYAIQSTAYAMLAHMKIFRSDEMSWTKETMLERDSMMRWLSAKRYHIGGFVSTQDTLVAMQALFDYSLNDPLRYVLDLSIKLKTSASPNWHRYVNLHASNNTKLMQFFPEPVYGYVIPTIEDGFGRAMLQIVTTVNVEYTWLIKPTDNNIQFYELEVERIAFRGQNFSVLEMTVCTRWIYTQQSSEAGMSVLEIDIPTGYIVTNETLREYVRSKEVTNLKHAVFYSRKLVFYFTKIDTTRTCVAFEANRWYPVANMTIQHRMKIFDHYEPGMHNTTIYTTYNLFNLNICDVCASYQCPDCPSINDTKQGPYTTTAQSTTQGDAGIIKHVTTAKPVSGSPQLSAIFSVLYVVLTFIWINI